MTKTADGYPSAAAYPMHTLAFLLTKRHRVVFCSDTADAHHMLKHIVALSLLAGTCCIYTTPALSRACRQESFKHS